jgi:hypothetical protein
MQHWHREHFSTHRFYADVLLSFAQKFGEEELDLLEPGRDRHGYDCVLIRTGTGDPLIRYIQMKSTEAADTPLANIHSQMLLKEHREVVQVRISSQGDCTYHFLADFGRVAYLALNIAQRGHANGTNKVEADLKNALMKLRDLVGGGSMPASFREVLEQWSDIKPVKWHAFDGQLRPKRGQLWSEVLKPMARLYRMTTTDTEAKITINPRWTRKVGAKELADFIFR